MCRIEQNQGLKGSQKWLQILINQYPMLIDNEILGGFSASAMPPHPNPASSIAL